MCKVPTQRTSSEKKIQADHIDHVVHFVLWLMLVRSLCMTHDDEVRGRLKFCLSQANSSREILSGMTIVSQVITFST